MRRLRRLPHFPGYSGHRLRQETNDPVRTDRPECKRSAPGSELLVATPNCSSTTESPPRQICRDVETDAMLVTKTRLLRWTRLAGKKGIIPRNATDARELLLPGNRKSPSRIETTSIPKPPRMKLRLFRCAVEMMLQVFSTHQRYLLDPRDQNTHRRRGASLAWVRD